MRNLSNFMKNNALSTNSKCSNRISKKMLKCDFTKRKERESDRPYPMKIDRIQCIIGPNLFVPLSNRRLMFHLIHHRLHSTTTGPEPDLYFVALQSSGNEDEMTLDIPASRSSPRYSLPSCLLSSCFHPASRLCECLLCDTDCKPFQAAVSRQRQ